MIGQLSMFDLLAAPERREERPPRLRPCRFSVAQEVESGSFLCFGSYACSTDLDALSPDPAFILDHFPQLHYYLSHDCLPRGPLTHMFVSFDDKDYSHEPVKYEKRYTFTVQSLLEEAKRRGII